MKAFLLIIKASNSILSDMISNVEYEYSLQEKVNISEGDTIIAYIEHPINRIQMILEASKTTNDSRMCFKKTLDCSVEIESERFPEIVNAINVSIAQATDIIEIEVSLMERVRAAMIKKLADMYVPQNEEEEPFEDPKNNEIILHTGLRSRFPRNRIIFGAPGTGKSFRTNEDKKELLDGEGDAQYERVTFHPDYSYANFVGTYKPIPYFDEEGKKSITYEYVPGPFVRVLVNALRSARKGEKKPFLLLIEEINRANVAAVFGDVFQLLDRNDDNVSEYPIQASEDLKRYLAKDEVLGGKPSDYLTMSIPDNMFIWATMNSADQGVFPMDTAFKRRWDFAYIGIDDNDGDLRNKYVIVGEESQQKVEWNKLRQAINNYLAKVKINEDKQLGPYFIPRSIVVPEQGDEINREDFAEVFKHKVIMYLFEDAAKQKKDDLFSGCKEDDSSVVLRYSTIIEKFDRIGIRIFNSEIQTETQSEIIHSTT